MDQPIEVGHMDDYKKSAEYKKENNDYGQNGAYGNYEIKDCARTIVEAEEIKKDADKMKYIEKCLKMKADAAVDAVNSIEDLRKIGAKKMKAEGGY